MTSCLFCWSCLKSLAIPSRSFSHLSFSTLIYAMIGFSHHWIWILAGFSHHFNEFVSLLFECTPKDISASPPKTCVISFLCPFQTTLYCCNFRQLCCKTQIFRVPDSCSCDLSFSQVQTISGKLGSWSEWGSKNFWSSKIHVTRKREIVRPLGSGWMWLWVVELDKTPWVGT